MDNTVGQRPRTLKRWLQSTPRRTFVLYPVVVVLLELILRDGQLFVLPWGIPLLPWGYLQYRLSGNYRTRQGGGGPGIDIPPEHIVDTGIYGYTRNPMYLGHLIFMAGLAITFLSLPTLALFLFHIPWFHRRALEDEERLQVMFGREYEDYRIRVKRWLPGIV